MVPIQIFLNSMGTDRNNVNPTHTVKNSVDFTVKYVASGCRFFYRYLWAFTCRPFLNIKIW